MSKAFSYPENNFQEEKKKGWTLVKGLCGVSALGQVHMSFWEGLEM